MDLSGFTVAISGLGLMGGSLALALRGHCARLLGVDPDPQALALARKLGVVDRAEAHPQALLPQADLIVLALPRQAMLSLISRLPQLHPGSPIVMDLGSTKRDISQAMDALPERFDPLPAHPICGKETSGLAQADPHLFHGAEFVLSPLARSSGRARQVGEALVHAVGARPVWLDPEAHDRRIAQTSHLPYLLACALAHSAAGESQGLVGPGFRSSARLAGTPNELGLDMLLGNRDNLLAALQRFGSVLDGLQQALEAADGPGLLARLGESRSAYQALVGNPEI